MKPYWTLMLIVVQICAPTAIEAKSTRHMDRWKRGVSAKSPRFFEGSWTLNKVIKVGDSKRKPQTGQATLTISLEAKDGDPKFHVSLEVANRHSFVVQQTHGQTNAWRSVGETTSTMMGIDDETQKFEDLLLKVIKNPKSVTSQGGKGGTSLRISNPPFMASFSRSK